MKYIVLFLLSFSVLSAPFKVVIKDDKNRVSHFAKFDTIEKANAWIAEEESTSMWSYRSPLDYSKEIIDLAVSSKPDAVEYRDQQSKRNSIKTACASIQGESVSDNIKLILEDYCKRVR